jgi:hypothetical protein
MPVPSKATVAAIDNSIAHWERMIAWAKRQPRSAKVSPVKMRDEIAETWDGVHCSLCRLFRCDCISCPLERFYGHCGSLYTENAWAAVARTWAKKSGPQTWRTWLKHANVMLNQLKTTKDKYKEK